jgi:hypothetical protein
MPSKGKSDLSGKALYLWPYEYWSHLKYTIKNMGISISAYMECLMLYNNTLSIKSTDHSFPPAKTTQIFSFAIAPYKLPLEQRPGLQYHLARTLLFFIFALPKLSFLF